MSRTCTVCSHEALSDIDDELMRAVPMRLVANRHGLSTSAVKRHKLGHLSVPGAGTRADADRTRAGQPTRLEQVQELLVEAKAILLDARAAGRQETALKAIDRATKLVELEAKLSGDLNTSTNVSVGVGVDARTGGALRDPSESEWNEVLAVLAEELRRWPSVALRIAERLDQIGTPGLAGDLTADVPELMKQNYSTGGRQ